VPCCKIFEGFRGLVHAYELEDEVGHSDEVEGDDDALAEVSFAAGDPRGEEQENNGDGEGGYGENEFVGVDVAACDDEELHGKAEEEEEVEFEEGDVNLDVVLVVDQWDA
jgi:hypothetical protein